MISADRRRTTTPDSSTPLLAEVHQLRQKLSEAIATIKALQDDRDELEADLRAMRRAASTDSLTGLWNRRFFLDSLALSASFATRHGLALSLVLLDVDHFKTLNDLHGHAAGDAALRDVAAVVLAASRGHDVVARYGGEEFAILLPGTDRDGAIAMADRLRLRLESRAWPVRPMTASFGAATLPPQGRDASPSSPSLIESADMAMYHSKRQGRNRVTHADQLLRPAEPEARAGFHASASDD